MLYIIKCTLLPYEENIENAFILSTKIVRKRPINGILPSRVKPLMINHNDRQKLDDVSIRCECIHTVDSQLLHSRHPLIYHGIDSRLQRRTLLINRTFIYRRAPLLLSPFSSYRDLYDMPYDFTH